MGASTQSAGARLTRAYEHMIAQKEIAPDHAQQDAVRLLSNIADQLEQRPSGSGLFGLFKKKPEPIKGAYIWGEVGRGKSMLMDLFLDHAPVEKKRRVHFHAFMDEVHTAITDVRAQGVRDPIPEVVKPILDSVELLCFDEFHVTDITNAMLLGRLFEKLFAAGVTIVATSNVAPDDLYKNGLNRQLFLPFIKLLKEQVSVFELVSETDYRREKLSGGEIYHFGTGADAKVAMDEAFARFAEGAATQKRVVSSLGREIEVSEAAGEVARFAFHQLCEQPLGARDYLRLSENFKAFVVDEVPQFSRSHSSAAKRFIQFVDTVYDRNQRLAASFAVGLDELGADSETQFEFQRCVSRLIEMQSDEYLREAESV